MDLDLVVRQMGNEMEDGDARFSMNRKGQFISFKNTSALFCFSSTIDENTDTVYLIEGFVF